MTNHEMLVWAIIVLQALDAISTIVALKGGAVEANPMMKKLFGRLGVAQGLLITKVAAVAAVWYYQASISTTVLWVVAVLLVAVVVNNIKVIRGQRK